MINLFLKIYQAFEDKKQMFLDAGLEPVLHLDKYRGQPLNPAQFEYYDIPAIFIDWRIVWSKSGKSYDGKLSLDFHVVTDATWDTSNVSTNHEAGLKTIVHHALIRSVLDDLQSENTSRLVRVDENPVDTGVVNYELLRYECNYSDPMLTGDEYIEVLIEALKISGQLVKRLD